MCFSVSISLGSMSVAGESLHTDHVSRTSTEVSHAYVLGALQRKKFKKSEITIDMEVGGWLQVSLGFFLLENRPEIALNQY